MMQSNEYRTSTYLQEQVVELKQKAPGLERYERAKELIKDLRYEIQELERLMEDTADDLKRLRIREKYLLKNNLFEDRRSDRSVSKISQSQISNNSFLLGNDGQEGYRIRRSRVSQDDWTMKDMSCSDSSSQSLRNMIREPNFFRERINSFV